MFNVEYILSVEITRLSADDLVIATVEDFSYTMKTLFQANRVHKNTTHTHRTAERKRKEK